MNKAHILAGLAACFIVAACDGQKAGNDAADPPLAGARIGGAFALTTQDGKTLRWDDLKGKYRIVYFGYSFCPDICPVDLQKIMAGYRLFAKADPARAAKVQPLFITVDPERDTAAVLKTYVTNFPPNLIGLTGTPEQIAATAKAFAVYFQKQDGKDYLVDHQRTPFLFGPAGEPIAILSTEEGKTDKDVARELDQMGALKDRFWEKPLAALDREEWEALCDGCGKCCLHKVEEEETGRIYPTNVACKLLDTHAGRCCNYKGRRALVPDCLRLSPKLLNDIDWLPKSCAYKLRAAGEPLPDWHYLISGDRETVHRTGHSVRGWTVTEVLAGDLEDHIVDREF